MTNTLQKALDEDAALTSLIDAEAGSSFLIYEVTISDVNGVALISSDPSSIGKQSQARTNISQLVSIVWHDLFREASDPPFSVAEASIALLVFTTFCLYLLMRKVRANEVVR